MMPPNPSGRAPTVTLNMVSLDPASPEPLQAQLYRAVRAAILSRQLPPGGRLPSTRALTEELGVSRNTVLHAFEQLMAEGYLTGRHGSGTYIRRCLPDEQLVVGQPGPAHTCDCGPGLANRAAALEQIGPMVGTGSKPQPLRPCLPSFDDFPLALWERTRSQELKRLGSYLLAYGDAPGYEPLRVAVAAYLRHSRGVRCEAEQVLITSGSQQGIDLISSVLLDPGDSVWIEDPGYGGARYAFQRAQVRLIPVPVDGEGMSLAPVTPAKPPRLMYITPSHQFPLGVTMSLARRMAMLDYARRWGTWILEDDYDSEFRYAGRPLGSLQGLDDSGHVLYVGTFSKVLFPSLRLGYIVVPERLTEQFCKMRAIVDGHSPVIEQATMAAFLQEGHLERHIRRMRRLYAERLDVLQEEVARQLPGLLELEPTGAGMHTIGWLPLGVNDRAAAERIAARGVIAAPLSNYALQPLARGGLVLGFTAYQKGQIRHAVREMKIALTGLRG